MGTVVFTPQRPLVRSHLIKWGGTRIESRGPAVATRVSDSDNQVVKQLQLNNNEGNRFLTHKKREVKVTVVK